MKRSPAPTGGASVENIGTSGPMAFMALRLNHSGNIRKANVFPDFFLRSFTVSNCRCCEKNRLKCAGTIFVIVRNKSRIQSHQGSLTRPHMITTLLRTYLG